MVSFLQSIYDFLITFVESVIRTITGIISLSTTAIQSINSVSQISYSGMVAIRGVIQTMPVVLFTVIAGTIAIILLIAVVGIFVR